MLRILTIVLIGFSISVLATEDQIKFNSEKEKEAYLNLTKELRCPKCQNQNIADSNAVVAKDMRVKTLELLQQGKSEQEVIDYMVQRYGQFAHYKPPINAATIMLWVLPLGFVLFAFLLVFKRTKVSPKKVTQPQSQKTTELDVELQQLIEKAKQEERSNND